MLAFKCSLVLIFLVLHVNCRSYERTTLLAHSVIPSAIPEAAFELPLETGAAKELRPQSWSLLEPRDLSGGDGRRPSRPSRPARYTGEKVCDGACISPRACEVHDGIRNGTCANGDVCCVFEKSCNGVSREKVSFFRSPHFPISLSDSLECSYRIYPAPSTCALRIDFERFELERPKKQKQVEKCVDDVMFIMNTAGGATEGACELEDHTAVVEVKPNSSHPIVILFVMQSNQHSWSLKITQINCVKLKPWKNLAECGRQLIYEPNEYDSDSQLTFMENSHSRHLSNSKPPVATPYIINGKDAEVKEFPWQISIQSKSRSTHRCGGSIINERYILTAAHCVFRYAYMSKHDLKVVVGDYILKTENDGEHEEFDIEKIIIHFNYQPAKSHVNDIAVIKLNGTISFSDRVQPVCLVDEGFDVYNKNAVVSGWGRNNSTDSKSSASRLQKLNVKIISNDECRNLVRSRYEEVMKANLTLEDTAKMSAMGVTSTQLCGISKNSTSVCFGDSGGPLLLQSEDDGRYYQAGVISYGLGRCQTDRQIPGSYTNLQKYLNFIAVATMEH